MLREIDIELPRIQFYRSEMAKYIAVDKKLAYPVQPIEQALKNNSIVFHD